MLPSCWINWRVRPEAADREETRGAGEAQHQNSGSKTTGEQRMSRRIMGLSMAFPAQLQATSTCFGVGSSMQQDAADFRNRLGLFLGV